MFNYVTSKLFKAVTAAVALSLTLPTEGFAEATHPAFLVVQVGFADIQSELDDGEPNLPYAEEMGGELLGADQAGMSHAGPCEAVWTIFMRFPDTASMNAWRLSDEASSLSSAFAPMSGSENSYFLAAPELCVAS